MTKIQNRYLPTLAVLLLLIVFFSITNRNFIAFSNLVNIVRQASFLFLLSLGLTGVVLTGNIDLSVGSVAALAGCVCAKMLTAGISPVFAIGAGLGIGLLSGLSCGILTGLLGIPSFVATYGVNMVVNGLAMIVMNGGIIYGLPAGFTSLGIGFAGEIPVPVILSFLFFAGFYFLYQKTTFGRKVYMIGLNKEAAAYSGISCFRILLTCYLLCGFMGAFGGIILTARLNAADAGMSETYGLQVVAAVVVGGTSLLGGEGGIPGTVLGALILTMIVNAMNINGLSSNGQNLVMGVVILLTAWLDVMSRKKNK